MPAEYRHVAIAPGHVLTVRREPRGSAPAGKIMVVKSHRPPFAVDAMAWEAGEIVR